MPTWVIGEYRIEIALSDALDCEVDEATLNDLALNMVLELNQLRALLVESKNREVRVSVKELRSRLKAGLRRVIMPLHRPASVMLEYIPESSPIAAASEVVRAMLQSQIASIERMLEDSIESGAANAANVLIRKLAQRWKTFLNPRNTSFTVTVWPVPIPSHCKVVGRAASSPPVPGRVVLSLLLEPGCGTLPTAVVVGGSGNCSISPTFDTAGVLHLELELEFFRSGEHTVHVLFGQEHVVGSPLKLHAEVQKEEAGVSFAADPAVPKGEDHSKKAGGGDSDRAGATVTPEIRSMRRSLALYLADDPSTRSVEADETDRTLLGELTQSPTAGLTTLPSETATADLSVEPSYSPTTGSGHQLHAVPPDVQDVASHGSPDSDCAVPQSPQHLARLCEATEHVRLLGSPPHLPSMHARTSHPRKHAHRSAVLAVEMKHSLCCLQRPVSYACSSSMLREPMQDRSGGFYPS